MSWTEDIARQLAEDDGKSWDELTANQVAHYMGVAQRWVKFVNQPPPEHG